MLYVQGFEPDRKRQNAILNMLQQIIATAMTTTGQQPTGQQSTQQPTGSSSSSSSSSSSPVVDYSNFITSDRLKGLSASQTTGLWFTIANNYYKLAGKMLEGSDSNRSIVPEHEIKSVLDNNGSVAIPPNWVFIFTLDSSGNIKKSGVTFTYAKTKLKDDKMTLDITDAKQPTLRKRKATDSPPPPFSPGP